MHAAIDANCLASASVTGYWNFIDYVHAHASEIGGDDHSVAKASVTLDKLAQDEGARQKVNQGDLEACIKKQDDTRIKASMKVGDALGLTGTPATFINGEKVDGVTSMENIFRMVDGALSAEGLTPPPPYKAPPAQTVAPVAPGQAPVAPGKAPVAPGK
jgi:protein-disulfide isomerase